MESFYLRNHTTDPSTPDSYFTNKMKYNMTPSETIQCLFSLGTKCYYVNLQYYEMNITETTFSSTAPSVLTLTFTLESIGDAISMSSFWGNSLVNVPCVTHWFSTAVWHSQRSDAVLCPLQPFIHQLHESLGTNSLLDKHQPAFRSQLSQAYCRQYIGPLAS